MLLPGPSFRISSTSFVVFMKGLPKEGVNRHNSVVFFHFCFRCFYYVVERKKRGVNEGPGVLTLCVCI